MRKLSFSILLFAAAPVFGQLDSHTLTISATRAMKLQPDQVVFNVSVTSPDFTSLDQIVGSLSSAGITYGNLTGISNNFGPPSVQWTFTLDVPLSRLGATITSLTKLESSMAQRSFLALSFRIAGTQVSQQAQQSQACSNADLIADATAQAQKLASAAGMSVGRILKLSNAASIQASVPVVSPFAVARLGFVASFLLGAPPSSPTQTCSLVVEFQLL